MRNIGGDIHRYIYIYLVYVKFKSRVPSPVISYDIYIYIYIFVVCCLTYSLKFGTIGKIYIIFYFSPEIRAKDDHTQQYPHEFIDNRE